MMTNFRTLSVPSMLDLTNALAFSAEIAALPDDVTILGLDFTTWKTSKAANLPIKPFGMLVVSLAVQHFKQRVPKATIMATGLPNNDIEGYAAHMGFFKACQIHLGKEPGEAKGSQTYLPITKIDKPGDLVPWQIEDRSKQLARQLTQQESGVLVNTLQFSFTEILRNVSEHAWADAYWLCAQYWPSLGEAEIALIDNGRGLHASLNQNPFIRPHLTDDKSAIKFALMPGISGRAWKGKPQRDDDVWANSGFGLYMNYRICAEGGSFYIATGSAGIHYEKESEPQITGYHLPGVALRLRMRAATLEDYDKQYHHRFLAEGEREAKKIEGVEVPTGERMSRMLRIGFTSTKETK